MKYILLLIFLAIFSTLISCKKNNKTSQSEKSNTRIIIDSDANNELDDQHAIAYALFNSESFQLEGITVNRTNNGGDVHKHFEEAERVVRLCNSEEKVKVYLGANGNFDEIKNHINEDKFDGYEAVNFIIERANAQNERKLILIPIGKLTNIALALLKEPSIAEKIKIVWLGSNYPEPGEYNQVNDLSAVNYLMNFNVDFEIALVRYNKDSGTDAVRVNLPQIEENMPGKGPHIKNKVIGRHGGEFNNFGDYSVSLFKNINLHGNPPSRALFDMAAVAIVKNPSWAKKSLIPSPILKNGNWVERPENNRKITIWENFSKKKIIDDFFYSVNHYKLIK